MLQMIGNDVVDLTLARMQSNWQRKGFLQKLFTSDEQEIILNNSEPELMVWGLWSMKEAAYKIYNRQTLKRGFFPNQMVCKMVMNEDFIRGNVYCRGKLYFTSTSLIDGIIHTIAVADKKNIEYVCEITSEHIQKDLYGLPYMYEKGRLIPLSKSHHGRVEKVVRLRF